MNTINNNTDSNTFVPTRLWNRYYILLFFSSFLLSLTMMMYNSVIALYIDDIYISLYGADATGSATMTGITIAAFTITAIIIRLVGGKFLDSHNYFKIIIIGLVAMCFGSLLYTFFPIIAVIIVIRLLQGGGFSLAHTGQAVAVCDVVPMSKLSEGISYFGLGVSLAQTIGPLLGLKLCEDGNFDRVFHVATIALVISIVCVAFCYYKLRQFSMEKMEHRAAQKVDAGVSYKGLWKFMDKRALPAALVSLMLAIPMGFVINFIPLFASRNGLAAAGLFYTCEAIAAILSRLIVGRIMTKYSPFILTIPATISGAAAFLVILLSPGSDSMLLVSGFLAGITIGLIQTICNVVALRSAPPERRGAAAATFFLSLDVGIGLGGLMWGAVIDSFGFNIALVGCIASMIIMFVLSALFMRSPKYLS